jgi:hypothetical protein
MAFVKQNKVNIEDILTANYSNSEISMMRVTDKDLDRLMAMMVYHNPNYILGEQVIKPKRKFFSSWLDDSVNEERTLYTLYIFDGNKYTTIYSNVDKKYIEVYITGFLDAKK